MKIKHALQEYLLEIEVRKYTQKTIRIICHDISSGQNFHYYIISEQRKKRADFSALSSIQLL